MATEGAAGGSSNKDKPSLYSQGVWKLRKAMFFWDVGHYGYELIYWCATFTAFFLSALWDEAFKLREAAAESGLEDASRRLMAAAESGLTLMLRRRLGGSKDAGEEEYEGAGGSSEFEEEEASAAPEDEFSPAELNTYAAFFVAAVFTLVIKYVVFPWLFMSLLPRLRTLTADSFALGMFCVFKAFGKLVKIASELALPIALKGAGEEMPPTEPTSAITSIGEYFGDFVFAPWLFIVYVMPLLKTMFSLPQAKKDSEP